jgi:hypothetical protein
METQVVNATEYRNVSLSLLRESQTNPRRIFEDDALKELAASIRSRGVLSPLLVRPLTEKGFEIVAGARRFRAAQLADAETIPVRIVALSEPRHSKHNSSSYLESSSVLLLLIELRTSFTCERRAGPRTDAPRLGAFRVRENLPQTRSIGSATSKVSFVRLLNEP